MFVITLTLMLSPDTVLENYQGVIHALRCSAVVVLVVFARHLAATGGNAASVTCCFARGHFEPLHGVTTRSDGVKNV